MIAIYPGSFDPVTNGHMDIIQRAAAFADTLVVAVLNNSAKVPVFTAEERVEQLKQLTASYANVQVGSFSGLLADYAKAVQARLIVRGLRATSDFEYEFQIAFINRTLAEEIETIFIPARAEYLHVSSSVVRELARYGGDISAMAPPLIQRALLEKVEAPRKEK